MFRYDYSSIGFQLASDMKNVRDRRKMNNRCARYWINDICVRIAV